MSARSWRVMSRTEQITITDRYFLNAGYIAGTILSPEDNLCPSVLKLRKILPVLELTFE